MGGDGWQRPSLNNEMFQSTPPHGGRRRFRPGEDSGGVSIHAPAWGGDSTKDFGLTDVLVSIHAPAWGATISKRLHVGVGIVSIHAPAWGATRGSHGWVVAGEFQSTPPHGGRPACCVMSFHGLICFNPRPRMGGDVKSVGWVGDGEGVSIHAPAWGATERESERLRQELFQSTPPHGGRHLKGIFKYVAMVFQSTPPHGGRRQVVTRMHPGMVSIHAPAWGATALWLTSLSVIPSFQSTPPHGGRHARGRQAGAGAGVSIHAPAWGATGWSRIRSAKSWSFNPRPRMGGDRQPRPHLLD